jgi:hypothetical protein
VETLEHFTSWKNQHESDSKELDELLAWIGIELTEKLFCTKTSLQKENEVEILKENPPKAKGVN